MKVRETGSGIQIYDFNAVESYKIAQKIEREGIRFYQMVLEKAADEKLKEALGYLRDAEEEHLKIFNNLLEGAEREAGRREEDDLLDSVDDGIFTITEHDVSAADCEQALQLGIIIEKRSLAFYLELEKHTESSEGKAALRKIITEERQHWEHLKQLAQ